MVASPAGNLSCGLWGQARESSPWTQAHPGAPFLLPPPEPRCPMSLRTLAGFPTRKGIKYPVYITRELQAPRSKAALPLTMGLALSSDVKACGSVPQSLWPVSHHQLSTLKGQDPCPQFCPWCKASAPCPRAGVLSAALWRACSSCLPWRPLLEV